MESSYQHIIHASSSSEAVTEAGTNVHSSVSANGETDLGRSQLFTQSAPRHEYELLPHHLFNQKVMQPRSESSSMQFNPSHSHQEQVHRSFQPSQRHPPYTTIQEKSAAIDLHQLVGLKSQSHHLHESTHNTGQTWTHFTPQSVVSGQQKPPELPGRLLSEVPSASADSNFHIGNIHLDDWISQAYGELQSVKEMHLSDLSRIYMKVCYSCLQPSSPEQAAKLEQTKGCIERMVQFLNTPRTEIVRFNQDKFYSSLYMIIKNIEKSKNSRGSVSAQLYAQSLSRLPLLRQWLDSKLQSQAANLGSSGNTSSSKLQVQEGRANLQLNKIELDRNIHVAGSNLKNILSSVHIGSSGSNPMNTLQQTNFSPTKVPPNFATSSPNLKWQAKKQTKHTQALNQPTNQPSSSEEKRHQMLIQKVNEINDRQQFEYSTRALFTSPCLKVSSMETHPLSLGHMYPKQFLHPLHKGSPSKTVTSPLVIASPSSPAMLSSSPICLEDFLPPVSSMAVQESTEHPQPLLGESNRCSQKFVGVTVSSIQNQLVAFGTPDKSASLSAVDITCPKENQRTSDNKQPMKSLCELVKSMSLKALIASVEDITAIITLIDSLSGEMVTSQSLKTICEDLATDWVHCSGRMSSSLLSKGTVPNRMKQQISNSYSCLSSSCNDNDRYGCLRWQPLDSELSAISSNKRQKTEDPSFQLNDTIIEEIKQTNQSLIETVVDVASGFKEDIDAIVRCSYTAVGLGHNLKQHNPSLKKLPILLVELLLPEDYPESSPRVLNTSSLSCSEAGGLEDLSESAKLMFGLSLRKLSEPFTLRDMAKVWDYCARSVVSEFAESFGGGSFSSKYGSWESCTTAA